MLLAELPQSLAAFPGRRGGDGAGVDDDDVCSIRRVGDQFDSHAAEPPRKQSGIRLIQTAAERDDGRGCHARTPFRKTTSYSAEQGAR